MKDSRKLKDTSDFLNIPIYIYIYIPVGLPASNSNVAARAGQRRRTVNGVGKQDGWPRSLYENNSTIHIVSRLRM